MANSTYINLSNDSAKPPTYSEVHVTEEVQSLPFFSQGHDHSTRQGEKYEDGKQHRCGHRRGGPGPSRTIKILSFGALFFFVSYKILSLLSCRYSGVVSQHQHHHHEPTVSVACPHLSTPSTPSDVSKEELNMTNRSLTQHESFLPITGNFELHDLLDLSTVTGSIDITVTPRPGSGPAVLKLRSVTGSITVRLADDFLYDTSVILEKLDHPNNVGDPDLYASDFQLLEALDRSFETDVASNVGSISVTYLIGNGGKTSFSSQTGSLDLDLRTVHVGDDDPITELETLTQPASQKIVVAPLAGSTGKITKLRAQHVSQGFGSVDAVYPPEWEGKVEAFIEGAGAMDITGDGLLYDVEDIWHIEAHRGEGQVEVALKGQGVGSLNFHC